MEKNQDNRWRVEISAEKRYFGFTPGRKKLMNCKEMGIGLIGRNRHNGGGPFFSGLNQGEDEHQE